MEFPRPPQHLIEVGDGACQFEPAHALGVWARSTFIDSDGRLVNPDHEHLQGANLLFVWSSEGFRSKGAIAVGTAQLGKQQGSLGKKELLESVYRGWFGGVLPDFVVTISAAFVHEASERSICALIEHELYHCAQARDEFGEPRFTEDGDPVWTMRGHDVEEFVGVVARYGAHSLALEQMRGALNAGPSVSGSAIKSAVCGCGAQVA